MNLMYSRSRGVGSPNTTAVRYPRRAPAPASSSPPVPPPASATCFSAIRSSPSCRPQPSPSLDLLDPALHGGIGPVVEGQDSFPPLRTVDIEELDASV